MCQTPIELELKHYFSHICSMSLKGHHVFKLRRYLNKYWVFLALLVWELLKGAREFPDKLAGLFRSLSGKADVFLQTTRRVFG